ncbi:hypothetical protein LN042_13750 [Kitasatospora sp. RB6PN24]|uniref:hypothetical protein n=1 Tax=Kitasatospora humi TaxID=2893891 RepID=UPI001E6568A6|nr:hypothetical protein [Kitasatospora humi]MCC9308138.1 hypothetical protein [Kitasatospora humi]
MSRTTIRTVGAAALLAAGLLLTGCSSSAGSSNAGAASASSSPSAGASDSGSAARAAYTACLKDHGVTLPTGRPSGRPSGHPSGAPGGGGPWGGGSPDPARQAAMQACASLRPQGGGGGRGNGGGLNSSAMQAFTSCLKDHGVTLPSSGGLRALNTADPNTAAAYKTCAPLLPARPSGAPSAGATDSPSA